jgi:hypothetical protein
MADETELAAFLAQYAQRADAFEIDHTIQVTSYGGTGTTALYRSFIEGGLSVPKGPGQWPFKHRRSAPQASEVPDDFRVVYIIGDPRDAVVSLFRRDYQIGHYQALHQRFLDPSLEGPMSSIEAFCADGVDHFALADHFEGWQNHPAGYPVMVLRYEYVADVWPEICDFVGLDPLPPSPTWRPRKSDWTSLKSPMREQLDAMYRSLAERVSALDPVQII